MKFSTATGLTLLSGLAVAQELTTTITSTLITYVTLGGSTFTSQEPITTVLTESAPALNLVAVNTSTAVNSTTAAATSNTTTLARSTRSPLFNASSALVANTSSAAATSTSSRSFLTATNTQATSVTATGAAANVAAPAMIAGALMLAVNLL